MEPIIKKSLLFIVLLNLIIPLVFAAQPSLPTIFYGRVVNDDLTPAVDIEVEAVWIDGDGVQHTTKTRTLSSEQNPQYPGYYFFNKGFVQAAVGSKIELIVDDMFAEIDADPGGEPSQFEDINLGGMPLAEIESPGVPTQGEATGGTGAGGVGSAGIDQHSIAPELPSNIYGQVTDQEGDPIPGEKVILEWTDENGEKHSITTKTLTEKQAELLGDVSYEGFYNFDEEDLLLLEANPGEELEIKSKDGEVYVKVRTSPGESTEANIILKDNSLANSIRGVFGGGVGVTRSIFERSTGSSNKRILLSPYLILSLLTLVVLGLVSGRKIKESASSVGTSLVVGRLRGDVIKLGNLKARECISEEPATVISNDTVSEVVRLFVAKETDTVFVLRNGEPRGIITETDVFDKLDEMIKDLNAHNAKEVMKEVKYKISPDMKLMDALDFSIENNISVIAVVRKDRLIGALTRKDIAREFNDFFQKNIFQGHNLPNVGSLMDDKLLLALRDEQALSVAGTIVKENTRAAFVVESPDNQKIQSMFSIREIIEELYSNPTRLRKLSAEHIGKNVAFRIAPGTSIITANRMMVDQEISLLPIFDGEELVGIVDQAIILKSIKEFLESLSSKGGVKSSIEVGS